MLRCRRDLIRLRCAPRRLHLCELTFWTSNRTFLLNSGVSASGPVEQYTMGRTGFDHIDAEIARSHPLDGCSDHNASCFSRESRESLPPRSGGGVRDPVALLRRPCTALRRTVGGRPLQPLAPKRRDLDRGLQRRCDLIEAESGRSVGGALWLRGRLMIIGAGPIEFLRRWRDRDLGIFALRRARRSRAA